MTRARVARLVPPIPVPPLGLGLGSRVRAKVVSVVTAVQVSSLGFGPGNPKYLRKTKKQKNYLLELSSQTSRKGLIFGVSLRFFVFWPGGQKYLGKTTKKQKNSKAIFGRSPARPPERDCFWVVFGFHSLVFWFLAMGPKQTRDNKKEQTQKQTFVGLQPALQKGFFVGGFPFLFGSLAKTQKRMEKTQKRKQSLSGGLAGDLQKIEFLFVFGFSLGCLVPWPRTKTKTMKTTKKTNNNPILGSGWRPPNDMFVF